MVEGLIVKPFNIGSSRERLGCSAIGRRCRHGLVCGSAPQSFVFQAKSPEPSIVARSVAGMRHEMVVTKASFAENHPAPFAQIQPFAATRSQRPARQACGERWRRNPPDASPPAVGHAVWFARASASLCGAQIINDDHPLETRHQSRVRNVGSGIKPAFIAAPVVLSATTKTTPSAALTTSPVGKRDGTMIVRDKLDNGLHACGGERQFVNQNDRAGLRMALINAPSSQTVAPLRKPDRR